jgi:hypothetical protein
MAAKFHERFDIEVGLAEAKRRFVNCVQNLIFGRLMRRFSVIEIDDLADEIMSAVGEKAKSVMMHSLAGQIGDDFYRNLQATEGLYGAIPRFHGARGQNQLEELICQIIMGSEVDLGIRWENGQFIKSGAALLDERLVNDPLRWLRSSGYETVRAPFEKGLSHFLHASRRPELLTDVVTDMYESLEALAKIVSGRPDKDLSANREMFLAKVKASDEYKQLLKPTFRSIPRKFV